MHKLLVIADDFTGALDTGVRFAEEGITTVVTVFEAEAESAPSPGEEHRSKGRPEQAVREKVSVSVLDLESRHLGQEQAFLRLQHVVSGMAEKGYTHFYKKTDSTLRGNIGGELAALLQLLFEQEEGQKSADGKETAEGTADKAIVCPDPNSGATGGGTGTDGLTLFFIPAYPKMGRTTANGRQYVNGTPLDQTEFAQDPLNPVHSSSVPDIIKEQTGLPVYSCKVQTDGESPSLEPAGTCQKPGTEISKEEMSIVVMDGQTDKELERTAAWLAQRGLLRITAGCAGFAEFLLPYLDLPRKRVEPRNCNSQMLVICGSVHPVSKEQMDAGAANGVTSITLTPESMLGTRNENAWMKDQSTMNGSPRPVTEEQLGKRSASGERGCSGAFDDGLVRTAVTALEWGEDVIVRTADSEIGFDHYLRYAEKRGFSREEMVERLKERLGRLAAAIFEEVANRNIRPPTLVLTGGDTAITVMSHLGIQEVQPLGSIEGGVAVCKPLAGSGFFPDHVVTKAGGFGSPGAVANIKHYLEEHAGR